MSYDPTNIFARILRGEIPCKKVYEDAQVLAFYDIQPKAPVHVLVIPRGTYVDQADFDAHASEAEIVAFRRAIAQIVQELGIRETGYRLISNTGANSGQEVPHYHVHILGGCFLGPLVTPP